jgi:hypothetical protein
VTLPYCCAIQCLPRNLATHDAERGVGKGGEARRGSAPLLLRNRVPRGFNGFNSYPMGETRHSILRNIICGGKLGTFLK